MMILNIIAVLLILWGFLLLCLVFIRGRDNDNPPIPVSNQNPHFGILIPARNESKVIEGLLESIREQTYPVDMEDVYVIIEDTSDPTVSIAQRFGATIIVRTHPERRRKGYALDEAIKQILKEQKDYDAYFVFDADNILASTFLEEMKTTYLQGYDTAVGNRKSKNGIDKHVISVCSILTFGMLNALGNHRKVEYEKNIIITGSGFYIKGDWIKKWKGYPFHTLTEDYEFSMYATLHGLTTGYNENAIVYDEQPTTCDQSRIQRTRWIRGFIECRKIYASKLRKESKKASRNRGSKYADGVGILPYVLMVAGAICLIVFNLIIAFLLALQNKVEYMLYIMIGIITFVIVYVILLLFTIFLLKKDDHLHLSSSMKRKTILFNPIFLMSYVPCALDALFRRKIDWKPIEHTVRNIEPK